MSYHAVSSMHAIPDNAGAPRRYLPVLLVLFLASGCSALIYEIVWYQLLQLVIGSTAVSLGVLLATFMGGLCLGSLGVPRVRRLGKYHPLLVYAAIELGIGTCGILALIGMPLVDVVYAAVAGHGMPAILLRAGVAAACLLPPTILMGASLPAAARWLESSPEGLSWLGLLYGANTGGAVAGCLLAGFYLLRVFDMSTATYVAASINAAVALAAWLLSRRTSVQALSPDERPVPSGDGTRPWPVYIAIALSGACALGAEVVWTRLLGLLLGGTVYTFSLILAVFLVGLGIGSAIAALWLRTMARPRVALGVCQLMVAAAVAWTAYMLADSVPYWPVNPGLSSSPWFSLQIDVARVVWTVLPGTLLWGASFPLALAAVTSRGSEASRVVAGVYAANTAGAILGSLSFSMVLVPWIGTQGAQRTLVALAAGAALFALAPLVSVSLSRTATAALAVALLAAGVLFWSVPAVPSMLIAYGRRVLTSAKYSTILYTGEGMNSSIAISRWNDGAVQFHVSGKVEASTEPYDMRLQRMLGHMPALMHPNPRSVLIVGFGAGVTAGSFVPYPGIEKIVICEMEPLIPEVASRYFGHENNEVLKDKRVRVVFDDARHYILTTREKFDIITSDPIHPWVKGSATLYSREYFELVRQHLNPGGLITQWVPLYESDTRTVKSELATFFDVFPQGTIWGNENGGSGYDTVLLGHTGKFAIDIEKVEARLKTLPYARVLSSINEVGFGSFTEMLYTYAGQAKQLQPWLKDAQINRDGNLRLQYLAGLALNNSAEAMIYDQILGFRRYPSDLFIGPPERTQALQNLLENRDGR